MRFHRHFKYRYGRAANDQGGMVLFFALIALVAMSLAGLVLVRSVDTSTIIAGNLAFKQAATTSGDAGAEAAIAALAAIQAANNAKNVYMDTTHAFNVTSATAGYYSNVDPALVLTADTTWVVGTTCASAAAPAGYSIRYIIQRMCRTANQVLSKTNCLFSGGAVDNNGMQVPLPQDICSGPGCPTAGQAPQYRITARVAGPKNTLSYVQTLIY